MTKIVVSNVIRYITGNIIRLLLDYFRFKWSHLNRIILFHHNVKIQRVRKCVPFICNLQRSALNIILHQVSQTRVRMELQGACEFNEKLTINSIIKHWYYGVSAGLASGFYGNRRLGAAMTQWFFQSAISSFVYKVGLFLHIACGRFSRK